MGGVAQPTTILEEKVANLVPSWLPKWIKKIDAQIDAKIDQKIDVSWDRFWGDFGEFGDPKSSQVGTKIDQKSMPIAKTNFLINRALPAAGA